MYTCCFALLIAIILYSVKCGGGGQLSSTNFIILKDGNVLLGATVHVGGAATWLKFSCVPQRPEATASMAGKTTDGKAKHEVFQSM